MGNFKVGFIVFSLENRSDFPDFSMSSNLGLYSGHLEDYVMVCVKIWRGSVDLFFFVSAVSHVGFKSQVLSHFLWVVVQCQFSSQILCFSVSVCPACTSLRDQTGT